MGEVRFDVLILVDIAHDIFSSPIAASELKSIMRLITIEAGRIILSIIES